ncbi:MAG: ribosome-associated translation inhibitor RaiA [Nitrospirae bacterium]|nr:ribosome-associated translation inhibitor RaiA [Nitrospirota bacterium]
MKLSLQVTARNFELTDAIKAEITEKVEKLENFCDQIMKCRVVVDSPHRHSHDGKLYNVNIDLKVPGSEIVVKREPNEDLYVAIRDSFNAAKRKIEEFMSQQRREVKFHEESPQGKIASLFLDKGYGFLTKLDGTEVYFHENSVLNKGFEKLKIGMKVRFAEELGAKGPQASSVTVLG